ncbi:MAG: phosphate ABC transporter substrate-binding protein [Methanomicrobiaceae archaeon]|nr:phosphate ABC transporter substrate-binding protein [Methanomicrobiaceae archaeon]
MNVSPKKSGLVLIALAIIAVSAIFVCGCTGNGTGDVTPSKEVKTVETLTVTGSTTVLPIAQAAAEAYMKNDQYADIQVSGGGSGHGVQAVGTSAADIGMASRDLKSSEKEEYPGLVQHVIASDGIAVIVYKDNPVDSLTLAQVKSIYKGEITNWNEVGGEDLEIVVVGRDSSSGTREFFYESVMKKEEFTVKQLEKNSNGAVAQTISQTPGAIGYVSMGYLDNTVKGLDIDVDGTLIEPTIANVISGDYPVARNLNMFTEGEATGLAAEYIAFIMSEEGQKIISDEGYVPVA